jgi:hypothetical protein
VKSFILYFLFSQSVVFADEVHQLAEDVIHVVEKSPGGDPIAESEGKFHLTKPQADLVITYSKVNKDIADNKLIAGPQPPTSCQAPTAPIPDPTQPTPIIAPHVGIIAITEPTPEPELTPIIFDPNPIIEKPIPHEPVALHLSPVEQVYAKLLDTPKDWQKILQENKDKLSSDEKISLVGLLGGAFDKHYNHARADDPNSPGYVNTQELLTSVATNSIGGICRDVALAQTQMLETLGFKNNYSVSYLDYVGRHTTVITTDPTTGKIVKFNYNEVTGAASGSGTEALAQNTTLADVGIHYKVYDTKGSPVVQVPSELGQILSETTGVKDREFNAKNYNLNKVSFEQNGIYGNFFSGNTSSGVAVSGVALYSLSETEHLKTHAGLSVSQADGNRGTVTVSASNIYASAGFEAQSSKIKLGRVEASVYGGSDVGVIRADASETYNSSGAVLKGKPIIDMTVAGFLGLKAEGKTSDGKTTIENNTYINMYPDYTNVASVDKEMVAKNSVIVDTKMVHQLDNEDKSILVRTALIFRNYGSSAVLEAGITNKADKTRFLAGYRTPLTSDQPSFLPGATTSGYVRGEKELTKKVTLILEYEEGAGRSSTRAGIEGKFD